MPKNLIYFYPNPARAGQIATFLINLNEPNLSASEWSAVQAGGAVTLDVFNLAGERIAHLQLAGAPGSQCLRWNTGNTPAGVYVYQLKIQGRKCGSGKLALRTP